MSSSTSKRKKVNVYLHFPFADIHNYIDVVDTTLSGSQADILRIETPGRVICYRLENVLYYEVWGGTVHEPPPIGGA